MKQKLIIGLLFILVLLQIASPLYMIVKRELVLKNGIAFRFKTVPIDPSDPFRGRYISLRVEANKAPKPQGVALELGQKVYAQIVVDENGYAEISQITTQKPKAPAFLDAKISSFGDGNEVFLDLPIDRYYMEEKAAPQAEKIYREHSEHDKQDAYVIVKVKNGFAVVEGLYIGGQKIENLLLKRLK